MLGFQEVFPDATHIHHESSHVPLHLRTATRADAAKVAAIYEPYVTHESTSFELSAPTASEVADRIEAVLRTHPWIVVEDDGVMIGYSYATAHRARPAYRWSTEVSVYVQQDRHRGRVGRALYTGLFDILSCQGFRNALAGITLPNPASVAFHEAMGFTAVGIYRNVGFKMGRWHDVAWYARPVGVHEHAPSEPILFPELVAAGIVERLLE